MREKSSLQETANGKQMLEAKSRRRQVSELESEKQLQCHRISKRLMELQLDNVTLVSQIQFSKFIGEDSQPKKFVSRSNEFQQYCSSQRPSLNCQFHQTQIQMSQS
jgi:hypothetical protein